MQRHLDRQRIGRADREVVDVKDCLRVPPDHPSYTLRRVWLSDEEDKGYYEGFSNEGLWPLCHIAHTRPIFRPETGCSIKRSIAALRTLFTGNGRHGIPDSPRAGLSLRVAAQDGEGGAARCARGDFLAHSVAERGSVWNLSWQRELVDGLLGADLIGFHIQSHCNNFLETVDRALEALTEWDRFAVNRQGHLTRVRPYPISVAFPEHSRVINESLSAGAERAALCAELGIEASLLGRGRSRGLHQRTSRAI